MSIKSFCKTCLAELWSGRGSLAGSDHRGDVMDWAGSVTDCFFGGGLEPHPASCAFHE